MKIKKRKKNDRAAFFNNTPEEYQNWRRMNARFKSTARELADTHVANELRAQERERMLHAGR